MNTISYFSFNTPQGRTISYNNLTLEEITQKLKKEFPKWTDDVITKVANNPKFHTQVIPITNEFKKPKKEKISFTTPIIVNGVEINKLLRLGKSLLAYHRNGFRQWGVCVNEIFDDWKITPYYHAFELKYEQLIKIINTANEEELKLVMQEIYQHLNNLQRTIKCSGILKEKGEFIEGAHRRLGLATLIERTEEMLSNELKIFGQL